MSTIDTHAFVKRPKAAGADEGLAEAIASGHADAGAQPASKADLTAELAKQETRLTNRFHGIAAVIVPAILLRPYRLECAWRS